MGGRGAGFYPAGRGKRFKALAPREREKSGLTETQQINNDANQRTNALNAAKDRGAATVAYRNVFGFREFYYWDGAKYTRQPVSQETQSYSRMRGHYEAEYDGSRFIDVDKKLGQRGRRR